MKAASFHDYWGLQYSAGGGPATRALSQRIGAVCAWAADRAGLSPSAVTLMGTFVFGGGALTYAVAPGGWPVTFLCLAAFQLAYGLDCADGQLARASHRTSSFGAWLDLACDYVRNTMLACAMSYWLAVSGTVSVGGAIVAGGVMIGGLMLKLHALTALRTGQGATEPAAKSALHMVGAAVVDTSTFLLLFALLREYPDGLALFGTAMGAGYGLLGYKQAARHLAAVRGR